MHQNRLLLTSLFLILFASIAAYFALSARSSSEPERGIPVQASTTATETNSSENQVPPSPSASQNGAEVAEEVKEDLEPSNSVLLAPIDRPFERVRKKPFGLEILPGQSPVANDRFTGIHVGVDFEIFEGEETVDIPVTAICSGPLRLKTFANGYGGVAIQTCELQGEEVSVIYGHLRLQSISAQTENILSAGELIGYLGDGHSPETDGVRKHLHLGIRKGTGSDIRGYVKSPYETADWYDVLEYLG